MSGTGNCLMRLSGLRLRYGAVLALQDIELELRQGDFIAIIGANGSGKTSLLQSMHGLLMHEGRREMTAAAARQVMVFQRPFMLRLSVWWNLRLALCLAGLPWRAGAERARQALQRAGLFGLRDRPARQLSGGQQQRLALARAWAVRPDLLFLDEPTANLDPSAKNEVEALLAAFHAEGMTVVMSTHNLGQAKRLASRVVYLESGRLIADQPTRKFFDAHVDDRTGQFLKGELKWDLQ